MSMPKTLKELQTYAEQLKKNSTKRSVIARLFYGEHVNLSPILFPRTGAEKAQGQLRRPLRKLLRHCEGIVEKEGIFFIEGF